MKENFDECFSLMLVHEGGYVNNPKDPGGMTNLGVTAKNWADYTGKPATESVMRSLTPELVKNFYKLRYWDKVNGDDLPSGVDYAVFDFAVNSGPVRAIKTLQTCVNVNPDGIIGPKTMAAVEAENPRTVVNDVCQARLDFLQSLSTYSVFGKGWKNRVLEVEDKAFKMAI
jgi:hypothetical protein